MKRFEPPKECRLDTILWFGKYRGKSIQDVLNTDPKYLRWALEEVENFYCPRFIEEMIFESAYEEDISERNIFEYPDDIFDCPF